MSPALQTLALSKSYKGRDVLDAVDLTVEAGSVFGFLGPNGAGKTTTLRLISGLARPSSGSIRVLGHDVSTAGNAVRARLGFLPDVPAFYEWMTATEFMHFAGGLFGLERSALTRRTDMLLETAGLSAANGRIGAYSRGMKQRLGIAQALINAPALLLLDEPTSALDPMGRKDVLDMIDSLRGRTTIFFSTHLLGDVERVCDSVAILDRGRVLTQAPLAELKARYGRHKMVLEVVSGADALAAAIKRRPWAVDVSRKNSTQIEVRVTDVGSAQYDLPGLISAQSTGLVRLETGEMGLEEVFIELVGEAQP